MSARIGTRRKIGRGRRQVVWYFLCETCGAEQDVLAKRRPSIDPDEDAFAPRALCHGEMKLQGLFFLFFDAESGQKVREEADKIRKQWEAARERVLYGNVCACEHPWWKHRVDRQTMKAHECNVCQCQQFDRKKPKPVFERGFDPEIPF